MKTNSKTVQQNNNRRLGGFETKKIIREFTELTLADEFGPTIGQSLDEHLMNCAKDGTEVQSITLHIDEEAWPEMVNRFMEAEKARNTY